MSGTTPSAETSAPRPGARHRGLTRGERLVVAGVLVATFGVTVAILPGGYSPFGPVKALVLLCGCACLALGFAVQPTLAAGSLSRAFAQRGAWPGLGLLGLACLATLTSVDPSQSFVGHYPEYQGLLLLLASVLVALGSYSLADKGALWRTLGLGAAIAVLAVAAYAALQFAGADPVVYERTFVVRRVRSTLGNGSNLGVFLCLALPLVIARARQERGAWRWIAYAAVAAGAVTLAWSLSRGAWVGAFAGAIVWLLAEGRSWDRSKRVRVATIALAVAVAAVALTTALVPNAARRMGTALDTTSGTAGWRTEVWSGAARLVTQRPLLGFGPGSFRYAFPPRRTAAMQAGETGVQSLDDPHNLFVSAGVSAGVLAVFALVWLLGEALLAAWLPRRDNPPDLAGPALAASIVAGVTALQFHFATLDSAPLLAAIVALALARRAPANAAHSRVAVSAARTVSGVLAAALALGAVLAGGLVLADREIARGYSLVESGRPWSEARGPFESAVSLAPWEPAFDWALGRGATQSVASTGDLSAFDDATRALQRASARLPFDSLVVAQTADAYIVVGLRARDASKLDAALPIVERSIAMDPENGYRWAMKGTALAGLGNAQGAVAAFERAVRYAPNDAQAWAALSTLYERAGMRAKAAAAQSRADTLTAPPPAR